MALLQEWQKVAYNEKANQGELQRFWQRYFLIEKGIYEKLLTNPDEVVEGTVEVIELMGSESYIYMKIAGVTFTVRVNGTTSLKVGDKAKVHMKASKIHLFNKETELRII